MRSSPRKGPLVRRWEGVRNLLNLVNLDVGMAPDGMGQDWHDGYSAGRRAAYLRISGKAQDIQNHHLQPAKRWKLLKDAVASLEQDILPTAPSMAHVTWRGYRYAVRQLSGRLEWEMRNMESNHSPTIAPMAAAGCA